MKHNPNPQGLPRFPRPIDWGNGPIVLGLGHVSGCGKDTVAKYMMEGAGIFGDIGVSSFALVDTLKAACHKLGYTEHPSVYDKDRDRREDTVMINGVERTIIEVWNMMGMHLRRFDTGIFVRTLIDKIELNRPRVAIITDMRYPAELNTLSAAFPNFFAVKINRPGYSPKCPADEELVYSAAWDIFIENKGDLSDLSRHCYHLYSQTINPNSPAGKQIAANKAPLPNDSLQEGD